MADKAEINDPAGFFLEAPLYTVVPTTYSGNEPLLDIFYSRLNFDGHCPSCKQRTTYSRENGIVLRGAVAPENLVRRGFRSTSVQCARDSDHVIHIWFFANAHGLVKVGQYPSLADVANDEARVYDSTLDKTDRVELHKAIGLFAHGVGIGAFAYLRRVFERLLRRTFDSHREDQHWEEKDWESHRVKERIALMKQFLPEFLHDCAPLYGVLSKGLHELDEEESKICFPVLKTAILEILEDEKRMKEKERLRAETQARLSRLSDSLRKKSEQAV